MFKIISRLLLRLTGWKVLPFFPPEEKCIILSAPHTSMWDFWWARLFFTALGGTGSVLVKEELFFFPMGPLLRYAGALPVKREQGSSQVFQISNHFKQARRLHLGIALEGTRQPVGRWKRGFYYIARETGVPVYLQKTDYATKTVGIFGKIELSDNIELDMKKIRCCYAGVGAKYPGNFSIGDVSPFKPGDIPEGIQLFN